MKNESLPSIYTKIQTKNEEEQSKKDKCSTWKKVESDMQRTKT